MNNVRELERPGTVIVLATTSVPCQDSVRERVRREDGFRYLSIQSDAGRSRFEHSRAAAYRALALLGAADARMAPSLPNLPPRVLSPQPLWLSISHTGGVAVAAASREGPCGVDVESRDRDLVGLGLMPHFCHDSELAQLENICEAARPKAVLDLWLAKESISKAKGQGLAMGFKTMCLPIEADGVVHHPSIKFADHGEYRLCLASFEPQ